MHSAVVNFASESALIEFDENIISESGLEKKVDGAGYHLIISNNTNTDSLKKKK